MAIHTARRSILSVACSVAVALGNFLCLAAQPPSDSLYAWFIGDTGVVLNSQSLVTNWQNQAGTGTPSNRNLSRTGGAPRLISVQTPGGVRTALRFSGANNLWSPSGSFGALNNARTLIAYLKLASTNSGYLFDGSTGAGMSRAHVQDGFWQVGVQPGPASNGTNSDPTTLGATPSLWQAHFFSFEPAAGGTRITHSIGADAGVTYTNSLTNALQGLIIGENVSQAIGISGDVAEFLVYDRLLDSVEKLSITSYLTNKWGQPSPFAPSPASTNLYAWYKGDVGVLVSGSGEITNWQNQAATGTPSDRDMTHVAGPPQRISVATPVGTLQALRFTGSENIWAGAPQFGSLSDARTVVVCCRLTSTKSGFLFDGTSNSGLTRAQVRNGLWQVGVQPSGQGTAADPTTLPATPGDWQVHFFSFNRMSTYTAIAHHIQGVGSLSYTNANTNQLSGLILGENVSQALGLPVDVAEVIVYDRLLPNSERLNVANYLVDKWISPAPVTEGYVASTTSQTSRTVPNYGIHELLNLQITAQVQSNAFTLTNIVISAAASTDPDNIKSLTVFYTAAGNTFSPVNMFATYSGPMSGLINLVGNRVLVDGFNNFWIAVEPKLTAPWSNHIDCEIVSLGLSGSNGGVKVPDLAAPPGFLTIGSGVFTRVLRRQGDNGVNTYRIPGLATTTNGTLIAVFDMRWDSSSDLPANIDIGSMRSTDNGNTWSQMQTVLDFDKSVSGSLGNGVGDPTILVDRQTGTIWVAGLWSYGNNGNFGSGPGLSTNQTGQYVLSRSDNDGISWSAPINITVQAKANTNWYICHQGPGNGIQLRDGSLVLPSMYRDDVGTKCYLVYSTNHGNSWLTSAAVATSSGESQVVELDDGRLMLSIRRATTHAWSTYTRGSNLGNGLWSALSYLNPDPGCQASFVRYSSRIDGHPQSRLLFSNPASTTTRENMTIRLSDNEGQTWSTSRLLDDRLASYSCMTVLKDGTIGVLYEAGASYAAETLTFARFSLDWLTQSDVDSDKDEIPDYYEQLNGLNPAVDDSMLDKDADGVSNLKEFLAGTNANDAASRFRIEAATRSTDNLFLTWSAVPWRFYNVEASFTPSGPWIPLPELDDIQATGNPGSISLPLQPELMRLLRIRCLPTH